MILHFQVKNIADGSVVNKRLTTPVRDGVSHEEIKNFLKDYNTLYLDHLKIVAWWLNNSKEIAPNQRIFLLE